MRFSAVILAAGKSRRMGRNKLLIEFEGRPLLAWVLEAVTSSVVEETLVVLGHSPLELRPILEPYEVEEVYNPDYEMGMSTSFKAGLNRVSTDAAFLVLGDQLGLKPALLNEMARVMEGDSEAFIVSPIYRDRRGHPVLFHRVLFQEILALPLSAPIKVVVDRYEAHHRYVEGDHWCVFDLDTPEDIERARLLFSP
jgi:molybdenum cofactor cytidylyltransferase